MILGEANVNSRPFASIAVGPLLNKSKAESSCVNE